LKIKIKDHPRFVVEDADIIAKIKIAPWQAALGDKIDFELPSGKKIKLTIPPESSSGKRLRFREKGLRNKNKTRGNLEVEIHIEIKTLDDNTRAFYEGLKELDPERKG